MAKLSFKSGKEIKTSPDFLSWEFFAFRPDFTRNAEGSFKSWNERTLDNNSKSQEEVKSIGKGKDVDKFKSQIILPGNFFLAVRMSYRLNFYNFS